MQLKILTLKVLGIGIIAYLLMMVVHLSGLYRLDAESWILLFGLTAAAAVQWSVLVCLLYYTGSLNGKTAFGTVLKKVLAFIPTYAAVIVVIVLFSVPVEMRRLAFANTSRAIFKTFSALCPVFAEI